MAYTTIDKGSKYFNTITWTGDNTNRTLTGVGFQPDWVWWKQRNGTDDHRLIDSVRGEGTASYKILFSDTTDSEYNGNDNGGSQGNINALNSDGFSGSQGSTGWNNWNGNGYNYVAWNWLGANTTASNTSGSITSTVSANQTAGFSIVSYTGTGANATVGHGLGVTPKIIITKQRGSTSNWGVWHTALAGTEYILLNSTAAKATDATYWNSTTPTSSVFSVGTATPTNVSSATYIAYCFADIKGYSKFGSYTGNGSADGTFVYTGFKPAWLMVKRSDSGAESWYMTNNKMGTFNLITPYLTANEANAEGTANMQDYLSNGFKIRGSGGYENASGGTYIYMAFAENPFVTSGGIPVTAR